MSRSFPRLNIRHAALGFVGIFSSRAKTLTVPSGNTPSRARVNPSGASPMPFNTSFTVPSPPAAMMESNPSLTASAANLRASPAAAVCLREHSAEMSVSNFLKRPAF